jgi:2-polyprenyl-6-hydroxyphenyl methylase/3-demethylubiquinone-9 3-methyltransferase
MWKRQPFCRAIKDQGFDVCGFDPSKEGIELASSANPDIRFLNIGVYDQPPEEWLGAFDLVVSTEVVEHLYNPRALPAFAKKVLKPGGHALITTPYHGYLKNLALSVLDKWDAHHTVFWEHGHIKFFSRHTLKKLFEDDGYQTCSFKGLGRLPWLWMTMLMEFKLAER